MKKFIGNLRMWQKLLIVPAFVFLFLLILSYGAFDGLTKQKGAVDDIFNNRFRSYQESTRVMNEVANVHANIYKVLSWGYGGYDAKKIDGLAKEQIAALDRLAADVKNALGSGSLTPEEQGYYKAVSDQLADYRKPALGVLEVASADIYGATMFMGVSDDKFQILNKTLKELSDYENKLSGERYDYSVASFSRVLQTFGVVLVVAVALSILTSVFITRLINRPLKEAIGVIKQVADGDLTKDVSIVSKDEIGELAQSVNAMRLSMNQAVGESLMTSQVLSEAASEQAASLEETSSSLDEMAAMIKQNADNTAVANGLIATAIEAIHKADASMKELTGSMKQIAGASEQTQKIVKSIDEIAFQTNLLALNAAVEAARAGEAGAGFAVVANEVRNLALRATEAAKSTSDLIEDIAGKVKNGEKLVGATDGAFGKVIESATKVTELMSEIAVASEEQSQGIDQINKAVAEMNQVTQQNAASAEKLSSIMAGFQTESRAETEV